MKNHILAAAAVFALALSVAPSFAASGQQSGNGNSSAGVASNCASILASQEGHSRSDVEYCENHQ